MSRNVRGKKSIFFFPKVSITCVFDILLFLLMYYMCFVCINKYIKIICRHGNNPTDIRVVTVL